MLKIITLLYVLASKFKQHQKRKQGLILWIDTETTGLDYEEDEVLEVACIITDMQGQEVAPRFHRLYQPSKKGACRLRSNEWARDAHKSSGLYQDLHKAIKQDCLDGVERIGRDFTSLQEYIDEHAKGAWLGGFSVFYDYIMLLGEGIDFSKQHHRKMDVSAINGTFEAAGLPSIKPPKSEAKHRAMEDNEAALNSYIDALKVLS